MIDDETNQQLENKGVKSRILHAGCVSYHVQLPGDNTEIALASQYKF